jgi:hypothetical protein
VHGPLAGRTRRAQTYVQCHRLPLQPTDLPILPNAGTAEVEFIDLESAAGLMTDPDYLANAALDEDNFHHIDRMITPHAEEHVTLSGPPVARDTGGVKVVQFVCRAPETSLDDLRAAWLSDSPEEAAAVEQLRAVRAKRWARVPEADDSPRFDGVRELWWPDQWSFDIARVREPEAWRALSHDPAIDPTQNGYLATTVNRVVWPSGA